MLKITEIIESSAFFELEPEWNSLLNKSKDDSVFLTWEAVSTCVKRFTGDQTLRTLCVKDGNQLIAIAPLKRSIYTFSGFLSYSVIEPLAYRHSDYTGFILTKKADECLKLIVDYLFELNDWDLMYLLDLPETSVVLEILPRISTNTLHFSLEPGKICPYISLPSSMEVLLSGLDGKFRKNLRRSLKKLQGDYGEVELKCYDEIGSVEEAMNIFFDLHQKRWTSKGLPGVFKDENSKVFFMEQAELYAQKGWLALYFLTVNDEPIAAQFCLKYKQKMHYGLGGFDPAFSNYSVGNIVVAKVLERCIANKFIEYDFMKGGEQYKFDWSAQYRRNMGIKFVNKKLSSRILFQGIKTAKKIGADKIAGQLLNL